MKPYHQLPNLLTLGNLLSGLLIIFFAFQHNYEMVGVFAIFCLLLDFFDGALARLLKVNSEMGKELDSLADMVSFGVAPGMVLFNYYSGLDLAFDVEWYALLIPVFSAYRLARFNVSPQSGEFFSGLPTPALAIAAFSLPLAALQKGAYYNLISNEFFLIVFVSIGSLLLLSPYKILAMKPGSGNVFLNKLRLGMVLLCITLLVLLKFFGLILCLIIYIVISLTIQKRLKQL